MKIGSVKNSRTAVPFGTWILFAGICVAPEAPASAFVAGRGRSSGTIQFPKFVARTSSALPPASTICLCSVGANCALPCPAHASSSIANPSTLNLNMIFSRRKPTPNPLNPGCGDAVQASLRLGILRDDVFVGRDDRNYTSENLRESSKVYLAGVLFHVLRKNILSEMKCRIQSLVILMEKPLTALL